MSVESILVIERLGRILEVPAILQPEGTGYGMSLSYACEYLDQLSNEVGQSGFSCYYVQADALMEAIIEEVGEAETDEEEIRQETLFLERAPYHPSTDGLAHIQALQEALRTDPAASQAQLRNCGSHVSYAGLLWDLKVLAAVLEEAASEERGFFLWAM